MNADPGQAHNKRPEGIRIVDLHAHPGLKTILLRRRLYHPIRLPGFLADALNPINMQTSFPNLIQGGIDVLFSTAYPLEKRLFDDIKLLNLISLRRLAELPISPIKEEWAQLVAPPYFTVASTMLDSMEQQVDAYNRQCGPSDRKAGFVSSRQELDRALALSEPPIVFIHSVEGGHALEGEIGLKFKDRPWDSLGRDERAALQTEVIANLNAFARRGVAYIVLAHFYPNKLIMPVFPYPEHIALSLIPHDKLSQVWRDIQLTEGLTELGEAVVSEMVRLGMLIDVSHATPRAREQIYELVHRLDPGRPHVIATHVGAYAINPSPYNLEDWEIRWIADHGGVIGVIFMSYWLMPSETKFGLNFVSRTIEHIINTGGPEVIGIGTDFDGAIPPDDLLDASYMPELVERLVAEYLGIDHRKHLSAQVEAILGGNALRVLRTGWGPP